MSVLEQLAATALRQMADDPAVVHAFSRVLNEIIGGRRDANHTSDQTFGDLLRQHRWTCGLTQEELAERAGISPRTVSDLERSGAASPRRDTFALLVAALQLSAEERAELYASVVRRRGPRPLLLTTRQLVDAPLERLRSRPRRTAP